MIVVAIRFFDWFQKTHQLWQSRRLAQTCTLESGHRISSESKLTPLGDARGAAFVFGCKSYFVVFVKARLFRSWKLPFEVATIRSRARTNLRIITFIICKHCLWSSSAFAIFDLNSDSLCILPWRHTMTITLNTTQCFQMSKTCLSNVKNLLGALLT